MEHTLDDLACPMRPSLSTCGLGIGMPRVHEHSSKKQVERLDVGLVRVQLKVQQNDHWMCGIKAKCNAPPPCNSTAAQLYAKPTSAHVSRGG
jgi:hypothetical protein